MSKWFSKLLSLNYIISFLFTMPAFPSILSPISSQSTAVRLCVPTATLFPTDAANGVYLLGILIQVVVASSWGLIISWLLVNCFLVLCGLDFSSIVAISICILRRGSISIRLFSTFMQLVHLFVTHILASTWVHSKNLFATFVLSRFSCSFRSSWSKFRSDNFGCLTFSGVLEPCSPIWPGKGCRYFCPGGYVCGWR